MRWHREEGQPGLSQSHRLQSNGQQSPHMREGVKANRSPLISRPYKFLAEPMSRSVKGVLKCSQTLRAKKLRTDSSV